ncbi:MAG: hypothetical protein M9888_06085 [Chitinophagales bacterium]|nr:hypothetical protein [Chitinophagales bacterium]
MDWGLVLKRRPREIQLYKKKHLFNSFVNNFAYWLMIYDQHRNQAFDKAFQEHIKSDTEALEIGTGHQAFLTRMAANHQPFSITSIEENKDAFLQSLKMICKNNYNNIRLLNEHSTQFKSNKKFNLLFHEIIGSIASSEGVVHSIRKIKQEYLAKDCVFIPQSVSTYFAPVSTLKLSGISKVLDYLISKNDLGIGYHRVYNFPSHLKMAKEQIFENLDFDKDIDDIQKDKLRFIIEKAGWWDGFIFFIDINFGNNNSVNSLNQHTNWSVPYIKLLDEPIYMEKDEILDIVIFKDLSSLNVYYDLQVNIEKVNKNIRFQWASTSRWAIDIE